MIIKFIEFITEFKTYTGPFSTVGFKTNEPTEKYTLNVDIKYDENNENIIKNILNKYNIPYDDLKLKRDEDLFRRSNVQKFKIDFLSYSGLEAQSIIVSMLQELEKSNIHIDTESIKISPEPEVIKKERKPIGFNR